MKTINLILTLLAIILAGTTGSSAHEIYSGLFSGSSSSPALSHNPSITDDELKTERIVITRYLSDGTVVTDTIVGNHDISINNQNGRSHQWDRLQKRGDSSHSTADQKPRKMSNVMLGLELSTAMDLSGTDMSTFNADLLVGYRHKVLQLLGASIGIHKSLGTRDSFIPIQILLRTSFRSRPSMMFMHFSTGYSFNTISNSPMVGDYMATLGAGVNLTRQPRFQSNIVLALGFRHLNQRHQALTNIEKSNLGFVQISFGISM